MDGMISGPFLSSTVELTEGCAHDALAQIETEEYENQTRRHPL